MEKDLITILGPTASGKTRLAACLAYEIDGEIISADSRQVYRGMDIGTGKDFSDYIVKGKKIPYYLIDIVDAGYEYNVYEYLNDVRFTIYDLRFRGKRAILCGGSGMYIEAVLKGYNLQNAPVNKELREKLKNKPDEELTEMLKSFHALHNVSDTKDRERLIRAIEIAHSSQFPVPSSQSIFHSPKLIFGIYFEREELRRRITERLERRLKAGMIEEVKALLDKGIPDDKLKYYGLEYKFITMYLKNEIEYKTMFEKLNTAIHQFAKRQMTWFRRMEKQSFKINWIDGRFSDEEKVKKIIENGEWRIENG